MYNRKTLLETLVKGSILYPQYSLIACTHQTFLRDDAKNGRVVVTVASSFSRFLDDDSRWQKITPASDSRSHLYIYGEQSHRRKSFVKTKRELPASRNGRDLSLCQTRRGRFSGKREFESVVLRLRTYHFCHEVINKRQTSCPVAGITRLIHS